MGDVEPLCAVAASEHESGKRGRGPDGRKQGLAKACALCRIEQIDGVEFVGIAKGEQGGITLGARLGKAGCGCIGDGGGIGGDLVVPLLFAQFERLGRDFRGGQEGWIGFFPCLHVDAGKVGDIGEARCADHGGDDGELWAGIKRDMSGLWERFRQNTSGG